jgi:hypothetical protein
MGSLIHLCRKKTTFLFPGLHPSLRKLTGGADRSFRQVSVLFNSVMAEKPF